MDTSASNGLFDFPNSGADGELRAEGDIFVADVKFHIQYIYNRR